MVDLQVQIAEAEQAQAKLNELEALRQQAGQLDSLKELRRQENERTAAKAYCEQVEAGIPDKLEELKQRVKSWKAAIRQHEEQEIKLREEQENIHRAIVQLGDSVIQAQSWLNNIGVTPDHYGLSVTGNIEAFNALDKLGFNDPELRIALSQQDAALETRTRFQGDRTFYYGTRYFK